MNLRSLERLRPVLAAVLLLVGSPAWSEQIGDIACHADEAWTGPDDAKVPVKDGPLNLNTELGTGPHGALKALLLPGKVASGLSGFDMDHNTHLKITEESVAGVGVVRVIYLNGGRLRWVEHSRASEARPAYEIATAACTAYDAKGTEFIVTYDPTERVSQVIGVFGEVSVRGVAGGLPVTVHAHELVTVRLGHAPSQPRQLDDAEMQQHLRPFEFIGGGKSESQATDHPLTEAHVLKTQDRAPSVGPPKVPWDPWPKWTDPVFPQPPGPASDPDVGIDF